MKKRALVFPINIRHLVGKHVHVTFDHGITEAGKIISVDHNGCATLSIDKSFDMLFFERDAKRIEISF